MKIKVEFLKERYYRNKQYFPGDIVEMCESEIDMYLELKVVKYSFDNNEKTIDLENMPYRELQQLCKNKNIRAVGTREELIDSLTA